MPWPDYECSIVSLTAGLAGKGFAGSPPPLDAIDACRPQERPLVLMVVDGLGDHWLGQFPDSFLARHRRGRLTSVFPSTTAAAVTSLALGVAPSEHGIPGWFTYFAELGGVAMPLPFLPRGGGQGYDELGLSPTQLLGAGSLWDRLDRPGLAVQPAAIAHSPYSNALFGTRPQRSYEGLDNWVAQIQAAASIAGNPWVWAYWTELDALGHGCGIQSPQAHDHFLALDRAVAELADALSALGALLVVTADHGLVDSPPAEQVWLEDHPRLAECLRLPLCGEPRAAFCYLRPGREAAFDDYVAAQLPSFQSLPMAELLEQGLFGTGPRHPRFSERLGDRLLLPGANASIRDCLLQESPSPLVGVHGGLSAEEIYVPLVVVGS